MEYQIPDLFARKAMGFSYSAFSYTSANCPVTLKDESELLSIVLLVANAVGQGLKLGMFFFTSVLFTHGKGPKLAKVFHPFRSSPDLPALDSMNRYHCLGQKYYEECKRYVQFPVVCVTASLNEFRTASFPLFT